MSLLSAFSHQLSPYIATHQQLVLALSGGLDSRVLLDLLARLQQQQPHLAIQVVHIHHGLSEHADEWLNFCESCCEGYDLPFEGIRVDLDFEGKDRGKGIEAAARDARYGQLAQFMTPQTLLLTGQHLDDQAETLLLALKRGAGPLGLAGMPEHQSFHGGLLIRPLLGYRRQALAAYAKQRQLQWVDDDSNDDQRFDRNFIRQSVLPECEQRWPGFSQRVARSAELCQEMVSLTDEVAASDLKGLQRPDDSLAIDGLLEMSLSRQRNVLRYWLRSCGHPLPSKQQLNDILEQVIGAREDANPCVRFGTCQIRRYRQSLFALPLFNDISQWTACWQGEGRLSLPDGLGALSFDRCSSEGLSIDTLSTEIMRFPRDNEEVSIRFSSPGSLRCQPRGRQHHRSLKKLWQEYNIPPWQRERLPMIFYGERLAMVVGAWVEQDFVQLSVGSGEKDSPEDLAVSLIHRGVST